MAARRLLAGRIEATLRPPIGQSPAAPWPLRGRSVAAFWPLLGRALAAEAGALAGLLLEISLFINSLSIRLVRLGHVESRERARRGHKVAYCNLCDLVKGDAVDIWPGRTNGDGTSPVQSQVSHPFQALL